MKKFLLVAAVAALTLSSCSSIYNTASTEQVSTSIVNRTTAALKVSDKVITYTLTPTKEQRRGGDKSVKAAAMAKALEANGGGDLIVAPQFEIKRHRGFFGSKIVYVTVTGHPAVYTDFHPTTQAEADIIVTLGKKH